MQPASEYPIWSRPFIGSCIAVLLGTLGLAALAVWPPTIAGQPGLTLTRDPRMVPAVPEPAAVPQEQPSRGLPATPVPKASRCAECGVVGSVREILVPGQVAHLGPLATVVHVAVGNLPMAVGRTFEITVRMSDGSPHIFIDPTSDNWRPGDRLIRIAGADPGTH